MVENDFQSSKLGRLPLEFYTRTDVLQIARDLLGKVLVTTFEGCQTAGRITETEAYRAPEDRASHAYANRRTARTEVMFQEGGRAYVYLCYGIHHMFNVVTAPEGLAHAVLVRAIEPLYGLDRMSERRGIEAAKSLRKRVQLGTGPGSLAQALGIKTSMTGQTLLTEQASIWIEDDGYRAEIEAGPRIGIDYAGESAAWPWRFWLKNSPFVKK